MNQLTHAVTIIYILSAIGYVAYLVRQDAFWNQAGYYLLIAGCLLHTMVIAYGTILAGHLPVRNLRETLSMVAWAMAALFILFQFRYHLKILGVFASPLSAVIMIISTQLTEEVLQTPASFNSIWLYFHIVTVFLGDAAFALAFGAGIFYLVQEQAIKTKTHGFFYRRLGTLLEWRSQRNLVWNCLVALCCAVAWPHQPGLAWSKSCHNGHHRLCRAHVHFLWG